MRSSESVDKTLVLRALATLLAVNSLLLAPVWIRNGALGPQWMALEALALVGLFLALPSARWSRLLAGIAGGLVVVLALLGVADTGARLSLARSLNLYLDLRLAGSVVNLLDGTIGPFWRSVVVVAAVLLAGSIGVWVAVMLTRLTRPEPLRNRRIVGMALVGFVVLAAPLRWLSPRGVLLATPSYDVVREQTGQWTRMRGERRRFAAEMAGAPSSYSGSAGLLDALEGRDVILAFVESYGMAALDDPRYAPIVRPRVDSLYARAERAGLAMVTGSLDAPSQGGMSWLGHASMLSGLWLDNQLRYDLLIASRRETLIDDFEGAGYRTAALMPAITLAWPEGARLGYEEIYARGQIDYRGPALNWVTMPDQYTWTFLERTIRHSDDPRPLFAELGLISSHAPWTPILPVLDDWDAIDDGKVFEAWADAGETPEELWRDTERVRQHYALSIGYAVDVLAGYVSRFADDRTLLIALGDHQPAPLVTGEDASRAVPVHVFAKDPELLRPFLEWGFVSGPTPPPSGPVGRMDAFRPWFIDAYSRAGDPRTDGLAK